MNDRYEIWVDGRFLHSWPTRDGARRLAKALGGVVKDLGGKS
jgi:hypothetical protein